MAQRYFQWIVGERRGEVLVFDQIVQDDNLTFIEFKDGSRINTELVAEINNHKDISGKFMAEVSDPNNIWQFKENKILEEGPQREQDWQSQEYYDVPTAQELAQADLTGDTGMVNPVKQKKRIDLIPPRPTTNKFGKIANTEDLSANYNESITTHPKVADKTHDKPEENVSDPVYIMMDKAKKADTEVDMTLTIQLPRKSLFDVAAESFDDGADKALGYIIENIDVTEIKEALKAGIASMYGITLWGDDESIEITEENGISDNSDTLVGQMFEPEVVQEPVVRDAKDGDPEFEGLKEELQEKADKINQENG